MKKIPLLLFLLINLIFPAGAQDIAGEWHGLRNYPDRPVRMILHLEKNGADWSATYDSPDNDSYGIQLEASVEYPLLSLRYESANITFKGVFLEEKQAIQGIYQDGDESFPLILGRTPIKAPAMSFEYVRENYSRRELYITMRDGKRLFTSIYAPKDSSRTYPILLNRTPYNIEPEPERYNGRLFGMWHLLEEGYIFVFQDVRGRFMSEGEFVDVRPFRPDKKGTETDDNSDTYDTIDWLVENVEHNNGRVGISGISYPGFYSTMALPQAHPALKAASPQAPVGNWFIGDDWHHNGAFSYWMPASFIPRSAGPGRSLPVPGRRPCIFPVRITTISTWTSGR